MKVLVYGAGVIGSYLAHTLCQAGHDVSLAARGPWKTALEQNGLVIRHVLQKKTTVDHPAIVQSGQFASYDVIFAVLRSSQVLDALPELAQIDSPLLVFVGNNLTANEIAAAIPRKTVLFGFQATAGKRTVNCVECIRWNNGQMTLGGLHRPLTAQEKQFFVKLFKPTKYKLIWEEDMDAWLKGHLALILPIAALCYSCQYDLKTATRAQRKLLLDAANEGFDMLKHMHVPVRPAGEDAYYKPGFKRSLCAALMFVLCKTQLGEWAASAHCRNASDEMLALYRQWETMRPTGYAMPHWDNICQSLAAMEKNQ